VPARVDGALAAELARVAKRSFLALGCRDVARIDLRLDAHGRVHFIECNPLPGLSPGWSDLCVIAESAGLSYRDLVAAILEPAIRRLRAQQRPHAEDESSEGTGGTGGSEGAEGSDDEDSPDGGVKADSRMIIEHGAAPTFS
ncbi:MAG: D-alanine--D-alanine ligase, partial [Myxococcales bacterium]|nr:D-alanine--D-alanine ligase [Myxococcales bacterium]